MRREADPEFMLFHLDKREVASVVQNLGKKVKLPFFCPDQ